NQGNYLFVPLNWNYYSYTLDEYQNQRVYIAWQCVSFDNFALFLDDIQLYSTGGWVGIEDDYIPALQLSAYPNPSPADFTIANKSSMPFGMEIYDIKGRKLYSNKAVTDFHSKQLGLALPSGVYLLRFTQNGKSYTMKQVIAK
ncbi:MAG: T9SS type A sorting domain-containing protein, partial [Candidatus Cloacimonetes bacterium]|nr:T9SS type A sorting domain-containing protein [Candidatus Cloacimonadota bacterium]